MRLSINKKKIYFYLFIFVFLNTIFNFKQMSKFSNIFKLNEIKSYYYFKSSRWDLNKEDNITIKLPFFN